MIENESKTTYLCPVLGKRYAQVQQDKCQPQMQNLAKTTLPISYIGIFPFITPKAFGGSEPLVVKILAEKFGFLSKFVPERAYDVTKENGTTFGMVHSVILN